MPMNTYHDLISIRLNEFFIFIFIIKIRKTNKFNKEFSNLFENKLNNFKLKFV